MGAQVYAELSEQCGTYNTENRFVLYVSLCVVNEVPTSGAVKWEREMIARSAKIRLLLPRAVEEESPHHQVAAHLHHVAEDVYFLDPVPPSSDEFLQLDPTSQGETIILRSVPIPSRQVRRLYFFFLFPIPFVSIGSLRNLFNIFLSLYLLISISFLYS